MLDYSANTIADYSADAMNVQLQKVLLNNILTVLTVLISIVLARLLAFGSSLSSKLPKMHILRKKQSTKNIRMANIVLKTLEEPDENMCLQIL